MLDLLNIKTSDILPDARNCIAKHVPRHLDLDYAALFETCRKRALFLWNSRVAPELDIQEQRTFERALINVGMRAGLSIPWTFASGYAFGIACHSAAGNTPAYREEAATACGLLMFFMGTYDHLLDEYPDEFEGVETLIGTLTIENLVNGRTLADLKLHPDKVLANGLLRLYQTYFQLCIRMYERNPDEKLLHSWTQVLKDIHRVESESVDRRISKVKPSLDLVKRAREPSVVAFWALAVTACLGESELKARSLEKFAHDYGSLAWYADDFADIEKDIKDDKWSGLAVRLSLEAKNVADIEALVTEHANQAGMLVSKLYEVSAKQFWENEDNFSIADILWAYIWTWIGGNIEASHPKTLSAKAVL